MTSGASGTASAPRHPAGPLTVHAAMPRPAALALLGFAFHVVVLALATGPAAAQGAALHDRQLAWRTYSAPRQARVRVFASTDERRPATVVVDDRADNGGPITDEAGFVADLAGREMGFDPTEATFVFRFTPAAFAEGAGDDGKTLLLRATFTRGTSGALGSAQWRVITADALDELTDRAFP